MDHGKGFGLADATARQRATTAERIVDQAWLVVRPMCLELVVSFLAKTLCPKAFFAFEVALLAVVRELGRLTINSLELEQPQLLPRDLWFRGGGYRRRNNKTRNTNVGSLLGRVTLWRRGYRSWERADPSIFPLEMMLGLIRGVTPGLADWLAQQMAEAGATQTRVLDTLRQERGVSMGVKRLRAIVEQISEAMAEFRRV